MPMHDLKSLHGLQDEGARRQQVIVKANTRVGLCSADTIFERCCVLPEIG